MVVTVVLLVSMNDLYMWANQERQRRRVTLAGKINDPSFEWHRKVKFDNSRM